MQLLLRHALVASPPVDRAQFAFLVREFVSCFYPGTEPTYGLSLFDEHIAGLKDGTGARRRVWAICDGSDRTGFIVATSRLDGSVKMGPLVVEPGRSSAGHVVDAVEEIAAMYKAEGRPYLYATHPRSNAFVRRLAERAGWNVAGVVRGLYRDDDEILIHRKLLDEPIQAPRFHSRCSSESRLVRKRGGSVLLRVDESDSVSDIELAGRRAAIEVQPMNRVCFSRVPQSVASALNADKVIRLVDGTNLVVWR